MYILPTAGGHATYLHVDRIRKMIPSDIPLHGFADAGYDHCVVTIAIQLCAYRYFLDAPNINGNYVQRGLLQAGSYSNMDSSPYSTTFWQ